MFHKVVNLNKIYPLKNNPTLEIEIINNGPEYLNSRRD